jgi:hypothetical protein
VAVVGVRPCPWQAASHVCGGRSTGGAVTWTASIACVHRGPGRAPICAWQVPLILPGLTCLLSTCVCMRAGISAGDSLMGAAARVLTLQLPANLQPTTMGHLVHCEYILYVTLKAEGEA